MIKALVIDLDGTLYPSSKEHHADGVSAERIAKYVKMKGLSGKMPKMSGKLIKKLINEGRITALTLLVSETTGIPEAMLAGYAYDIDPSKCGIRKDERLKSLLLQLCKKYKLWIFTNGHPVWVNRVLGRLDLATIFGRRIVHMNDLGKDIKPSPASFRIFLKKSGFARNEILFIDDKIRNVNAARSIGIKSVLADNSGMRGIAPTYAALEKILKNANRSQG